MMDQLLYCTGYEIIYVILLNMFIGVFFYRRDNTRRIYYLLQVSLIILNTILSLVFEDNIVVKQLSVIGCNMLFTLGIFELGIKISFFMSALFQCTGMIVEIIAYYVMNCLFDNFASRLDEDILANYIMGYFCLFVIYCFIIGLRKIFGKKMGALLQPTDWMRFSIFPLLSLVAIVSQIVLYADHYDRKQGYIFLIIDAGLLIMNIYIFGLLNDVLKREAEDAEYKLVMEKGKDDMELYHSILENYCQQQKNAHEFKNHILCISALMKAREFEELEQYVDNLSISISTVGPAIIDTNNKLINVILNEKYKEAREKGVTFVFKVNDLSYINIADIDMVIVLSNLINNALEATEKCSEKLIRMKFIVEEKQIILSVGNNCKQSILKVNNQIISSKNLNTIEHGYGIGNIIDVIKKYDGEYSICVENGWFQFNIIIPIAG